MKMNADRKDKRLNFIVNSELHKKIKILAAKRDITMNLWLMQAVYDRMKKEELIGD